MNLYIILFAETNYTRKQLTEFFSSSPDFGFWFCNLPNSVFVRTNLNANQISTILKNKFGKHRHFITELSQNSAGIIPTKHLNFFKDK